MNSQEQPARARVRWREPTRIELTPILAAALDAFYDGGFHGTSVRDISRRVGFTVPAIYYHHENKEAVLVALLNRSIDHVIELCEAAIADAGQDPELRFCNLIEALVLFEAFTPRTAFLDREIHALSPANLEAYATRRDHVEDLLHGTIEDGVAARIFDVRQPRDAARALLGMIQAVWTWYRPDGPQTPRDVATMYTELAARSIGCGPATVARIRRRAGTRARSARLVEMRKAAATPD